MLVKNKKGLNYNIGSENGFKGKGEILVQGRDQ